MGQVIITIDRREYAIACDDGEEAHILKLSRVLDEKAKLLSKSVGLINENMMLAMIGLLLADEIQEMHKKGMGNGEAELKAADAKISESIDSQVQKIKSLIKDIHPL